MGIITRISGPLVVADGMAGSKMYEVVKVGTRGLIGEIIQLRGSKAMIQVYEDTTGLKPNEKVANTGELLSVELAPGILGNIFDGLERPLEEIKRRCGDFVEKGIDIPSIDKGKKWKFVPTAKKGATLSEGDIIGYVQETPLIKHQIMVPYGVKGKLESIKGGSFKVEETIAVVRSGGGERKLSMLQRRPVRVAGRYSKRFKSDELLVTGQRVVDTFFPIAKGGTTGIPGPFGSGKTVILHSIAKYADSDVVVYVGCGERGNEMAEVLNEFPELKDPKSGRPLMERTILVANTSNMPVAAREASIYTGITVAEYFRDMGYDVSIMADSTSRWAEAMREMSARLEEMPGEEGYPAYLQKRLAEFYERSGRFEALGGGKGSISIIGAVSPPGGDISEPVSQGTLRVVKVFWALDASLAGARHFPSINWLSSYSLYKEGLARWYDKNGGPGFRDNVSKAMEILQREAELKDIVQLVGPDALPDSERAILEAGKIIREDFLRQSAFDEVDAFATIEKQYLMLGAIIKFAVQAQHAVSKGVPSSKLQEMKARQDISRMKFTENGKIAAEAQRIGSEMEREFESLIKGEE
ncbi:MAG: V-type ATP synthase subunit A [Candidatus Marsarchaeota archaeon]|jgi:V/A-type H+-transporting ATPase subunit A|nr:V-type ATP synthase subunit A [Candidatus Marsarchaeota archaeon]